LSDGHVRLRQFHLAGFDHRQVDDVIDDIQEVFVRILDVVDILFLYLVFEFSEDLFLENAGETNDRIQGVFVSRG